MSYNIYILECHNGSYYVGITTDLLRRYQEHLQGINCRYTSAFPPKHVAAAWLLPNGDRGTAQKIEYFIKKQSKVRKTEFIQNPSILRQLLIEKTIITEDVKLLHLRIK